MLLDNAIDDHNKRTRRTTYLHLATTKRRDDETSNNGSDKSLCRTYTRRNTKSNRQRDCYNTYNHTRYGILEKLLLIIGADGREEFWTKHVLERKKSFHTLYINQLTNLTHLLMMIGLPTQNGHGSIELFYKKQPYHLVREGHFAQRYLAISTLIYCVGKTIWTSNYKHDIPTR